MRYVSSRFCVLYSSLVPNGRLSSWLKVLNEWFMGCYFSADHGSSLMLPLSLMRVVPINSLECEYK